MPLVIRRHGVADVGMGVRPAGDGPFPAVMLLHGSEGAWSGYSDMVAAVFAAHGLSAVPFGYSVGGDIWNAGDVRDVPIDRTVEALAALRAWTRRGSSEGLLPSSPIEVERYEGPVLIAQGTEDRVWSSDRARRLEARLRAAGRAPEMRWYVGKGHGAWGDTANLHWEQVIAFFRRHLARALGRADRDGEEQTRPAGRLSSDRT